MDLRMDGDGFADECEDGDVKMWGLIERMDSMESENRSRQPTSSSRAAMLTKTRVLTLLVRYTARVLARPGTRS